MTTLGTGVDGAVRRIATAYEVRGMRTKLTSYDNPTVGSGSVVNESQFAYNSFGQLTTDYQSHSGAVNTGTTAKVQYAYADGSANMIRPTSMTYPNSRSITSNYGSSGGMNDVLSRVESLKDGSTALAQYSYLGDMDFVETNYTEPSIKYTLVGTAGGNDADTGDIYRGLDRFDRVKDAYWYNYGGLVDSARIQYGYDRAGNRIYRNDVVATALSARFDEQYNYDAIERLKDMARGTLNAGKSAISTKTFGQCWTLDATGNWKGFREDTNGDGAWDLIQSRTANTVNEISAITNSVGSAWANPTFDTAGDMTSIPKPASPSSSFTATYDAWNRLVKLAGGVNTVQENQYDGRRFRIVSKNYAAGVLTETRHYYYSSGWRVLEERLGTMPNTATAERQFVWGKRYIDDLLLRDRDATGGGTVNERLYGLQDANWNIIAVTSNIGTIQERYAYTPYGNTVFLTSAFVNRSISSYAWEILYAGYRWDANSGLYNLRYRAFNPTLGTWVTRDRSYRDGKNLYQYVRSMPVSYVDSLGLAAAPGNTLNTCIAECEMECYRQFPSNSFWDYVHFVGCTSGCRPGCEGRDFSITCAVATFHGNTCWQDAHTCLCNTLGEFTDTILPNTNPYGIAASVFQCILCDIWTDIQTWCTRGIADTVSGAIIDTLVDCGVDLAGQDHQRVLEIAHWALASAYFVLSGQNPRGFGGGVAACYRFNCNCI